MVDAISYAETWDKFRHQSCIDSLGINAHLLYGLRVDVAVLQPENIMILPCNLEMTKENKSTTWRGTPPSRTQIGIPPRHLPLV